MKSPTIMPPLLAALLCMLVACSVSPAAPAAAGAAVGATVAATAAPLATAASITTEVPVTTEVPMTTETSVTTTQAATETTTAISETAKTIANANVVTPLDPAECESIHQAIAKRLGVTMEVAVKDFASNITNSQGTACTISATGTGKDFNNMVDTAQAIREVLTSEGWKENPTYQADGPTGTHSGYEMENKVALVHVSWQPSPDVKCPTDQPISACDVEPSQQDFTVLIELVQNSPQ